MLQREKESRLIYNLLLNTYAETNLEMKALLITEDLFYLKALSTFSCENIEKIIAGIEYLLEM